MPTPYQQWKSNPKHGVQPPNDAGTTQEIMNENGMKYPGAELGQNLINGYNAVKGAVGGAAQSLMKNGGRVLGSFEKGGSIKKTGVYKLHKGEEVLNKKKALAHKMAPRTQLKNYKSFKKQHHYE